MVSDGPRVDWPAFLTKMSTLPNSELTCLQAASIAAAFETSQLIAETLPLAIFWISPLASASAAASRARIATSAPEAANSLAIARPSPLLPPVTIALLPSSRTSIISSSVIAKSYRHSREGGNPERLPVARPWTPAFAGVTRSGTSSLCREPVDLVHVFTRQGPVSGPDIGPDPGRAGRAGHDVA